MDGLQKLVLRHHQHLLGAGAGDDLPPSLICLDEGGNTVPVSTAFEASKNKAKTEGGLGYFEPTPGEGYYAHLRRARSQANAWHGQVTTWEVEGPDWNAVVVVRDAQPNGALLVSVERAKLSTAGSAFLDRFA